MTDSDYSSDNESGLGEEVVNLNLEEERSRSPVEEARALSPNFMPSYTPRISPRPSTRGRAGDYVRFELSPSSPRRSPDTTFSELQAYEDDDVIFVKEVPAPEDDDVILVRALPAQGPPTEEPQPGPSNARDNEDSDVMEVRGPYFPVQSPNLPPPLQGPEVPLNPRVRAVTGLSPKYDLQVCEDHERPKSFMERRHRGIPRS